MDEVGTENLIEQPTSIAMLLAEQAFGTKLNIIHLLSSYFQQKVTAMAGDIFLKISGIKGESMDSKHRDEIEIISWNWGGSGSGRESGPSHVKDLSVVKFIDRSSPTLLLGMLNGRVYAEVKLTNRKAGSAPLDYMVLTLSRCRMSSVDTSSSAGEDLPTETVCFSFDKFVMTYTPQNSDGSGAGKVEAGWDLQNAESI